MDRKEREERLKRLGKEDKSFSILSIINILIIALATGLFLWTSLDEKLTNNSSNNEQNTENQSREEGNTQNSDRELTKSNSQNNNNDSEIPLSQNQENLGKNKRNFPNLINEKESFNLVTKKIIDLANKRDLPIDKLSISLIDFSEKTCPSINQNGQPCYSKYEDTESRYPASLVKLFWLVIAYDKNLNSELNKELTKMIVDSDNEAASIIVDNITKTKSTKEKLPEKDFKTWQNKRQNLNQWFKNDNINISQKTFPIPSLEMDMPEGTDLQLRFPNGEEKYPIRNKLTSKSVATLLYEIYTKQFPQSDEMLALLRRDLNPSAWEKIPFNAIKGFLGEGIKDKNVEFYSKMGWTFNNRNDAAIVKSSDGKIAYILVIFGDDPAYYKDVEFLPKVSKMVYEEISQLSQ